VTPRGFATGMAIALLAGGTGLAIGLLAAPASGRETRRRWKRRAEDGLDDLERRGRRAVDDKAKQMQRIVEEGVARGKRAASRFAGS